MKLVNFKKIKITNFLSIGEDPIEINFNTGLNYITGINKDKEGRANAVGKSSIKRAIFWSLFGEDIYGIKNEFLINNITKKSPIVEIEFETTDESGVKNNYIIKRQLKPSKCVLLENGNPITLSTISLTNKKICELLHASPEMFKNCVIMSLNDTISFMEKNEVEKRKFIEQLFNLDFFDKMLLSIRNDFNKQRSKTEISLTKLEENKKSLDMLRSSKIAYDEELKNKSNVISEKIQKCNIKINELRNNNYDNKLQIINDELQQLKTTKKQLSTKLEDSINSNKNLDSQINELVQINDNHNNSLKKLEKSFTENEYSFKHLNAEINKIEALINKKICPTCFTQLEHNEKLLEQITENKNNITTIKNNIKKLKNAIETIEQTLKTNKDKIKILTNDKIDISDIQKQIYNIDIKLNSLSSNIKLLNEQKNNNEANIENIQQEIKRLENEQQNLNDSNPYVSDIQKLEQNTTNLKEEYDNDKDILDVFSMAKFVISEEGVKSLIIKKILNIFNSKMLMYLNKMQSNCICTFDEFFDIIITNEKGVNCSYYNFSGAEKKAIDMACLFTFMDMRFMLANVSYNLVIYDELLDSSFDSKGINIILDIIKERVAKYQEATYIISHRRESLQAIEGDLILLEKLNGITRRLKNV